MWARVIATMSSKPSRMAWRAVAISEIRAAWNTGNFTARLNSPTRASQGAIGDAMPGMLSGDEMHQLGQASGEAFDRMFLQMMITHHQGAITMATTELSTGQNPDARHLAQRIIDAQQREIAEMQTLLGG